MLIYTTLAADSFHRANENPVNPSVWSDYPPTSIPANQIISDELEPASVAGPAGDSISIYSGITWPINQWAQVQIDACNSPSFPSTFSSALLVMGRGAGQTNGYAFEVDGPLGPNCNVIIFSLNNDVATNYLSNAGSDVQIPLFAGDSIRMELFNGTISAYVIHDAVSTQVLAPIAAAPVTLGAAPLNNGPVALDLFMISTPSDVQVSNFSGGLITQQAGIPVDTYFIVTPGSNVQLQPGAYATLGATDLFFYITETGSLNVVNMNSTGNSATPGLISYALAQGVKWMDVITMPGNGVVQIYYADQSGKIFYAPYTMLGGAVTFQQLGDLASAVTFSTIYAPNSSPNAFLMMIDDGTRHNLYVATDPLYQNMLSNTITFNNSINTLVYLNRPSIAMHPSDVDAITVTCQQTVIMTSQINVGFYEAKVPGIS